MLPIHWKPRIHTSEQERQVQALVQQHSIPELLARITIGRGMGVDEVDAYLNPRLKTSMPDPFHLNDMDKAAARIVQAIQAQETIAVFGDYDVDGATSSSLLVHYLRAFGLEPIVYIPDRMKEGYGPSVDAFAHLASQGASLIITVDCGTVSYEPIVSVSQQNIDVIVVDHHIAQPQLPEALAVINPNRLDQDSNCGHLAAVGVTWLLLAAVNSALRDAAISPQPDLLPLLDLVALGTVCDVVSLSGLNRAFVAQGLKVMAARQNMGLRVLSDVAHIDEAPTSYHLGFLLGPRINAGGRVGEASLGYQLLCSEDEHACQHIAQKLDLHNSERQAIERMVLEAAFAQAQSQANHPLICVVQEGWHEGVIGIVAGRLKEEWDRPAMVLSITGEAAKGSARSVAGADIGAAVSAAKQQGLLSAGGGHAMAAGFSLPASGIEAFTDFMRARLGGAVQEYHSGKTVSYDAVVHASALTLDTIALLSQAEPYGMGNPAPRLVLQEVQISFCERMKDKHLRVGFKQGEANARAVAFNMVGSEAGNLLEAKGRVHVLGQLKRNRWQGRDAAQFIISDVAAV